MLVAPLLFRRPYLLQLKRAHSPEKVVKKMLVKCDLSTLIKRRVRSAYEINVYKQLVFKTMRVQKARFFSCMHLKCLVLRQNFCHFVQLNADKGAFATVRCGKIRTVRK